MPVGVSLFGAIIMSSATTKLAEYWIPRMILGETLMGVCVTEPSGGSDAGAMKLRCRKDGDYYVLDGEKTSITFADCADAFIVFARTGTPESGAAGVTALVVPADAPGIARTRFDDVGSHIIGRGSVFFEGVRVPAENRLGQENQGLHPCDARLRLSSRALIALQCIGCAQASLDEAWEYTKTRTAFNAPIASYQGVTSRLVEGESQIAAIRQLCYHAIALRDAGLPHTAEAAMVKWMGPKTAFDVIHQCLLTFGHYGWSMDLPHQQRMRDVMGLEIGDGTAGIMKLIVARERVGRAAVQSSRR